MAKFQWGDNRLVSGFIWRDNQNAGNPSPTITNITTPLSPGSSTVITGTNFGATQSTGTVQFSQGAALAGASVTAWADTSITVLVPSIEGSSIAYGDVNLDVFNSNADTATFATTINPAGSRVFIDVTSYDSNSAGAISFLVGGSDRDPVAGDQLAYDTQLFLAGAAAVAGFSILVNSDLSYNIVGSGLLPNGSYEFRNVRAYDAASDIWGDLGTVGITIATAAAPLFSGFVPDVSTEVGEYFSLDLNEFFQNNPTTFASTGVTLPVGVTLNTSSGVLAGTGTQVEDVTGIVITASNGSGQDATDPFGWEVTQAAELAPVFSGTIPNQVGTVNDSVSVATTSFFSNNPTNFVISSSAIPQGLVINSSGVVQGTLTTVESLVGITITASNSTGLAISNEFTWDVSAQGVNAPPVVTPPIDQTIAFDAGTLGLPKNDPTLVAAIATASANDDSDSVTVSGDLSALADPIPAGTHVIPFTSSPDSEGLTGTANWILTVAEAPPAIIQPVFTGNISDLSGVVGVVENLDISDNWINDPVSYSVTGSSIPDGISISNEGILSGTYTTVQELSNITITATNSAGNDTSNTFSWSVVEVSTVAKFTGTLRDWQTNEVYSNKTGIKVSVAITFGGNAIHQTSITVATDALGNYSFEVPEASIGTSYYVQKESEDGAITSLQKQIAVL